MISVKHQEPYKDIVVQVGNSRDTRLPADFFHAHPDFAGKVEVMVAADGAILVSAKPVPKRKTKDDGSDPVAASFLQFMEKQMTEHPEDIAAADAAQLRRTGELVKGIEVA